MESHEIKETVADLLLAYGCCIDEDRLEEWPDFFTEQCVYRIVPWENASQDLPLSLIYCDSRGMLLDRVVAHRKANLYAPHIYRHLIGGAKIAGEQDGVVSSRASYVVFRTLIDPIDYGRTEIYSVGVFHDKIVFEGGKAKFTEKIVVADTARIQSLMVTPI